MKALVLLLLVTFVGAGTYCWKKVATAEKKIDGYKVLVGEMRNAGEYATCEDYPRWQPEVFVIQGTVICQAGIRWISTNSGMTGTKLPSFFFDSGVTDGTEGEVIWHNTSLFWRNVKP
jgi:hypothetical protein